MAINWVLGIPLPPLPTTGGEQQNRLTGRGRQDNQHPLSGMNLWRSYTILAATLPTCGHMSQLAAEQQCNATVVESLQPLVDRHLLPRIRYTRYLWTYRRKSYGSPHTRGYSTRDQLSHGSNRKHADSADFFKTQKPTRTLIR